MRTPGRASVSSERALAGSSFGLLVLLAAFRATLGLGVLAAVTGLVCGGVLVAAVARAQVHGHSHRLGPADLVTLCRATLTCGLAALTIESFLGADVRPVVVVLTVVALILDALDGHVARRSATVSPFGARFDGEADAFLLLVLSAYVAPSAGMWVVAIGVARYLFGAARGVWRWLGRPLPFRYWRKVVTAVQGIVLAAAAAGVLAPGLRDAALLLAVALLAESFGRDVVWLWQRRAAGAAHDRVSRPQVAAP